MQTKYHFCENFQIFSNEYHFKCTSHLFPYSHMKFSQNLLHECACMRNNMLKLWYEDAWEWT